MPFKRFECFLCCEEKLEELPRWVGERGSRICDACARDCVAPQFYAALEYEYQYPPMCGKDKLDYWTFWDLFDDDFREAWREKEKEYATPVKERVYCEHRDHASGVICGIFLGRKRFGVKYCSRSRCHTCMNCGTRDDSSGVVSIWHHICKESSTEDAFRNFRRGRHYQECPNCKTKTFRGDGCNHMTCRPPCSAHFCFICGRQVAAHHSGHWQRGGCPRFGVSGPRRVWDSPGAHSEDEDDESDGEQDLIALERDVRRVFQLMGTFAGALRFERDRLMFTRAVATADSDGRIAFYSDLLANLDIVRQMVQTSFVVDRIPEQLRDFNARHRRIRNVYESNRNNPDWQTGPVTRLSDLDGEFNAYLDFALETIADMNRIAVASGRTH